MPSYSSEQFYRDWRYAISKDFVDPSGSPFQYAENGKQSWGDELHRLEFDSSPNSAAISHKAQYLAIAVDDDIHIFDADFKPFRVLQGHTSRVDAIAFKPGDANILVSCAMNHHVGTVPTEPTIIFWDLNSQSDRNPNPDKVETATISHYAARAVTERLTDLSPPLKLARAEQEFLASSFEPFISQALARNNVAENTRILGRLCASFQSEIFSPSGKYMLYLPGRDRGCDNEKQWDIKIYSTEERRDMLTLTGHRDRIMWMGYSQDETLIGTVAWDQTMNIWNAEFGEVKFTFKTVGQNWTGGFSPDSKMFAGTCGDGSIHVYSLEDGSELFWSEYGKTWCRALSWSSDSSVLAVGGRDLGKVVLIDVGKRQVVQERVLSTAKTKIRDETMRRFLNSRLEVCGLKFVDGGGKIVHLTSGDGSAEVYDLANHRKLRFARAGTDSYSLEGTIEDDAEKEEDKVTSKGGFQMEVWEDTERRRLMVATVDGDAVRIWAVSLED